MPPYNQKAADQFPHVAQDTGYSPVAELLQLVKGRPTTSGIMPIGMDPMQLLQGVANLQGLTEANQTNRHGIVQQRINDALAQAEQDALQRRMDEQNKLLAAQSKIARTINTPYSSSPSTSNGYTPPVGNFNSGNNNNITPFPKLPNLGDTTGKLKFPVAKPVTKTKSQRIPKHILDKSSKY